jgi:hypothetical protein
MAAPPGKVTSKHWDLKALAKVRPCTGVPVNKGNKRKHDGAALQGNKGGNAINTNTTAPAAKKGKKGGNARQPPYRVATAQQQMAYSSGHTNIGPVQRPESPLYTQNEGALKHIFEFMGDGYYLVLGTVCKAWNIVYRAGGPRLDERRPGTAMLIQSRTTTYELVLHNEKFLQALWHEDMVKLSQSNGHDGR